MLKIQIEQTPFKVLKLEHSLAAIREWEANYKKSFFNLKDGMTEEESEYYVQCMLLEKTDVEFIKLLTQKDYDRIAQYMNETRTATKFYNLRGNKKAPSRRTITSEILYHRMIVLGIPFECQYWHIDQLTTLMQVCIKEGGAQKSKMSKKETAQYYRKLNEERRKQLGTRG